MADDKGVEVGVTGREGFVGLPLDVGWRTSPTRSIVSAAGTAFKIQASDFVAVLDTLPTLAAHLRRFGQVMALQASLDAACNRFHDTDQRLSKWPLMYQDRVGNDVLALTHDFLAELLGARRASITEALGRLQKTGRIASRRGHTKIQDRAGLKNIACDCYSLMNLHLRSWNKERGNSVT
jgi:CRP-like cAMP-binding protein